MTVAEKKSIPRTSVMLDRLAILFFGRYGRKLARTFELEKVIREAGLEVFPSIYAARLLLYTSLSLLVSLLTIILILLSSLSIISKVILVVVLGFIPIMVFVTGLIYPSTKKGSRQRGVDSELPYMAAYMSIMARAGMAPEKIVEMLANLKVFKAIREEALRIVRDMKIFGFDPLTAIEHNAYVHPSRDYKEFMLGYVTAVRTGGDIIHYLEIRTQEIFQRHSDKIKSIAGRVGLIIEAYITLAIIGTLSFYVFFIVSGIIPVAKISFGGINGLILYSFVLMPLFTLAMIMAIDSAQPKTPSYHKEPYAWLLLSIPLGVLVVLVLISLTGSYKILLGEAPSIEDISMLSISVMSGLIAVSAGPAYSYLSIMRRERRIHHSLAEFIRDLAEVRKTGLSPEKSIIMLAERDYGVLTPIVRRLAGALATGLSVHRALRESLRGYRDWFLLVNMRILSDAIEVGGGSPTILDAMARYVSTLASLIEELRRRLRAYSYLPYFGSILVAVSSILVITMLSQSLTTILGRGTIAGVSIKLAKEDVALLLLTTSIGSIFNAWLMGLMVGKVQTTVTAAGFMHSIILTVLTTLVSVAVIVFTAQGILGS